MSDGARAGYIIFNIVELQRASVIPVGAHTGYMGMLLQLFVAKGRGSGIPVKTRVWFESTSFPRIEPTGHRW